MTKPKPKPQPDPRRQIDFTWPGRMMSGNKTGPKGHVCVWNANVLIKSKGKVWFGDLDLTTDADDLKRLARERGEDVFVLREGDCRFTTEATPRYENAVAIATPAGSFTILQ